MEGVSHGIMTRGILNLGQDFLAAGWNTACSKDQEEGHELEEIHRHLGIKGQIEGEHIKCRERIKKEKYEHN